MKTLDILSSRYLKWFQHFVFMALVMKGKEGKSNIFKDSQGG